MTDKAKDTLGTLVGIVEELHNYHRETWGCDHPAKVDHMNAVADVFNTINRSADDRKCCNTCTCEGEQTCKTVRHFSADHAEPVMWNEQASQAVSDWASKNIPMSKETAGELLVVYAKGQIAHMMRIRGGEPTYEEMSILHRDDIDLRTMAEIAHNLGFQWTFSAPDR